MSKLINLTGQRFGSLLVVGRADSKRGATYWHCKCDCGDETDVRGNHLRSGKIKSCGCGRGKKHDHYYSVEYSSWRNMLTRCYNHNHVSHERYSSKGVQVCDRWRQSFQNFLEDMGPSPGPGYSIDRIDNDGDYEPGNCRWADAVTQSRNHGAQRRSKTGVRGVQPHKRGGFVASIYADGKRHYLGLYQTLAEATATRKKGEREYWGGEANAVHTETAPRDCAGFFEGT